MVFAARWMQSRLWSCSIETVTLGRSPGISPGLLCLRALDIFAIGLGTFSDKQAGDVFVLHGVNYIHMVSAGTCCEDCALGVGTYDHDCMDGDFDEHSRRISGSLCCH